MSRTRDPGIFCWRLEWLLCCSSAALGQGGTTGAVVAAIERGGAGGGGTDPNYAMLLRCSGLPESEGKRARENVIGRERELAARFARLSVDDQRLLLAHYLATGKADSKIRARFGQLSGIVLYLWVSSRARARELERAELRETSHLGAEADRQEALRCERRLAQARTAASTARGPKAFQRRSRMWLLRGPAKEAWAKLGQHVRREGVLLEHGSVEADAKALALACTRGDPPPLEAAADAACRTAHAAWYETGRREAKRWADDEEEQASPAH